MRRGGCRKASLPAAYHGGRSGERFEVWAARKDSHSSSTQTNKNSPSFTIRTQLDSVVESYPEEYSLPEFRVEKTS